MIDAERVRFLNDDPVKPNRYVLYWMQQSQRTRFNHALEYAIEQANALHQAVIVCFALMDGYPEANERHYAFMLEGLRDVEAALRKRLVRFVVKHGDPPDVAVRYAKQASLVVCDRGYLRHQRRWRELVADRAGCRVVQVESDVVVPVEAASDKAEFAARTLRPKIHRQWKKFLRNLGETKVRRSSLRLDVHGDIDVRDVESALAKLKIDRSVGRSKRFIGGQETARSLLKKFLTHKLANYDKRRNEPSAQATSTMSPYLHFGQISPAEVALAVAGANGAPDADRDSYLEELIVRRELAVNFCYFHPKYDAYESLPPWARRTLAEHRNDKREHRYTLRQLEGAATRDPYWNAAQREMTATGFMHNYMRMYWGKRILEWAPTPQRAFEWTLHLNNKYFIDGRDPNAYANVGWIFGLHDRPWGPERKIFGKVRYMNAAGLERKFDMDAYVRWVSTLPGAGGAEPQHTVDSKLTSPAPSPPSSTLRRRS